MALAQTVFGTDKKNHRGANAPPPPPPVGLILGIGTGTTSIGVFLDPPLVLIYEI